MNDFGAEEQKFADIRGNSDNRDLRSRDNGHSMTGAAWSPKAVIQPTSSTSEPSSGPIDVRCSAIKVDQRIFLSVGHCLFDSGSWKSDRRITPGADSLADYHSNLDPSPNKTDYSYERRVRGNWFDYEWTNYDFGLLTLSLSSPIRCLYHHGWQENASGLTGDFVWLFGYPDEDLDCSGANSTHPNGDCYASLYGDGGDVATEIAHTAYTTILTSRMVRAALESTRSTGAGSSTE